MGVKKTPRQWKHPRRYIDHQWRKSAPTGYCHCESHRGYLDNGLIKRHNCLKKQCPFFQKYKPRKAKGD